MPLEKVQVVDLDNQNHRRRLRETLNKVLDHGFDDSKVQTAAEKTSGTPVINAAFPPGHLKRYNGKVDGTSDDRPAFEKAYAQFKAGGAPIIAPSGTSYLSKAGANTYALKFDGNVHMVSEGKTTLLTDDDDYNHILIDDGTDVDIFIKGFKFDHGSSSVTAESTDHICVRIESSINTIRVEDVDCTGFLADAFYIRADVTGSGGYFKNVTSSTGGAGRSLVTVAKGEKLRFIDCYAIDIGLQAFVTAPVDNSTVCRNIDFINCAAYGGGNYSVTPFHNVDRAAFFGGGETGASADDQSNIRFINCRVHDYGNSAGEDVPLVLGIETREAIRPIVVGMIATNVGRGGDDTGLYSYLTTGAVYQGCISSGNGKGLWMNDCDDYSDIGNNCIGNTVDRDYNGPDGLNNYIQADGLNFVLGRAGVSFSGGSVQLNAGHFNLSIARRGAAPAGDFDVTFLNPAGDANYSVLATFRGHTAAGGGLIQSASHTTTGFRFQTYSGGSLSDQACDILVIGPAELTTVP